MTTAAPPRPPTADDSESLAALDALIEEARRRTRRRRRRYAAAAATAVAAGVALLVGIGRNGDGTPGAPAAARTPIAAAAGRIVVVTMRGFVHAARTLHVDGGPVHYRVDGHFRVVWRVPADALKPGRTFGSSYATVSGTTSARFDGAPSKSCRGVLVARRAPFVLRVVHNGYDPLESSVTTSDVGVIASPSPIATAGSPSCSEGRLAAEWRRSSPRRSQNWWVYNHPGGSFYGPSFLPTPKGGGSDGWIQGWGPAGSFRWLAAFSLRQAR